MVDLPSLSDEELARESQGGSFTAFEELVRRFETRVHAFLFQCCGNATDARELTQETFVKAFQALHQFDARQSFAPWLFTIARRKSIDHFRARRRFSEESPIEEADANDPSALLEQQDEAQHVWETARRTLPPAQYQALWLYYVEEMNVAQVATALGKTQTHIKVMLLRARHALSKKLVPENRRSSPAHIPTPQTATAKGGYL
jgi:RNA polymerase sigma-70 factor (ECF subfamily)